ncbi:hypothetical protein ACFSHQ_00680 [Gemmobacter lanyuensis]
MPQWIDACATDDIDEEDLIRFDHAGATYAIYHSPKVISSPPPACAPMRRCISVTGW